VGGSGGGGGVAGDFDLAIRTTLSSLAGLRVLEDRSSQRVTGLALRSTFCFALQFDRLQAVRYRRGVVGGVP